MFIVLIKLSFESKCVKDEKSESIFGKFKHYVVSHLNLKMSLFDKILRTNLNFYTVKR